MMVHFRKSLSARHRLIAQLLSRTCEKIEASWVLRSEPALVIYRDVPSRAYAQAVHFTNSTDCS